MLASRATRATLVSRSRGARLAGLYLGGRRVLNAPAAYGNWASVPADGLMLASVGKGAYTVELLFTGAGSLHIQAATDAPITLSQQLNSVEYLVAAGGAGGGSGISVSSSTRGAGGGAAGGLRRGTQIMDWTAATVTVGAGGAGGLASGVGSPGNLGGNSVLGLITALGGGCGGSQCQNNATSGGSGGGQADRCGSSFAAAQGTFGQGNVGGVGTANPGCGGGGGGAGGAGGNGTATAIGVGGAGVASTITGTAVTYCAGGNGGSRGTAGVNPGTAVSAAANSGSGGNGSNGGINGNGGSGGSGVVIVAYANTLPDLSVEAGLTYTRDTVGRLGFKVYRFTAGTGKIAPPLCTYTGGTHIYSGTVLVGGSNVFGTGSITVYKGATLLRNGYTLPNAIINNGGTVF